MLYLYICLNWDSNINQFDDLSNIFYSILKLSTTNKQTYKKTEYIDKSRCFDIDYPTSTSKKEEANKKKAEKKKTDEMRETMRKMIINFQQSLKQWILSVL